VLRALAAFFGIKALGLRLQRDRMIHLVSGRNRLGSTRRGHESAISKASGPGYRSRSWATISKRICSRSLAPMSQNS